jgi:signal peptidase I
MKMRRRKVMKKFLSTLIVAGGVVLVTATFGYAEFTATGASSFPYFQLGCLVVGGLIIISLKHKYHGMYTVEAVGAFALYTVFVSLFTSPVIDAIKVIVT